MPSYIAALVLLIAPLLGLQTQTPTQAPTQPQQPAQSEQPAQKESPSKTQAPSEAQKGGKIPAGSRFFLASMEGNLEGFIAAEIVKKKLPVTVTTDENSADYVLTGTSIRADDRWYHTVFGGKDKNEGNVTLINVKEKRVVWAGEAGDRSLWWGGWSRGGQRKVASRIVSKMKHDMF